MLLKIGKGVDKAAAILSSISYVATAIITVMTVIDVLLNKTIHKPILGAYELTEQLMLCAVFASFAYTQTKKGHIEMGLVLARLPRKLSMLIFSVMSLLSAGVGGLLGYCAVVQGIRNLTTHVVTATLFIPVYPFTFIAALSMFGFTLVLLYDTVLSFTGIWNKEHAEIVASGWSS